MQANSPHKETAATAAAALAEHALEGEELRSELDAADRDIREACGGEYPVKVWLALTKENEKSTEMPVCEFWLLVVPAPQGG